MFLHHILSITLLLYDYDRKKKLKSKWQAYVMTIKYIQTVVLSEWLRDKRITLISDEKRTLIEDSIVSEKLILYFNCVNRNSVVVSSRHFIHRKIFRYILIICLFKNTSYVYMKRTHDVSIDWKRRLWHDMVTDMFRDIMSQVTHCCKGA